MPKDNMHVVIFAGGSFTNSPLCQKILKTADIILAADSGAESVLKLEILPEAVIGDFDSLKPSIKKQLAKKGVQIISFQQEKDETDTELAVLHAEKLGATKITILGGLAGDRIDHIAATLLLGSIAPIPLYFVSGNQAAFIVKGPTSFSLKGKPGDLLSLIPVGGKAEKITTKNLYYPLKNETLLFGKPRGVSNVFNASEITVFLQKGYLFVVHTHIGTA